MRIYLFILSVIFILASCSSSNKISNSWKNPEATQESAKFQTVAVFAMVKNPDMRMDVEESIASQMPNTIAVPSYKMITNEELADINAVKKKLSERGMEGALVLSVRNVDQKTTYYSSGMYPSAYYSFGGYYNYAWNYMYDPYGYSSTNVYVDLEILIYSLKNDQLVWYGESTSVNPETIQQTISELAVSVKNQLVEDGLLDPTR
jgi:PBP1b-binding outer membrane lipoprotein LpoB